MEVKSRNSGSRSLANIGRKIKWHSKGDHNKAVDPAVLYKFRSRRK